MTAALPVVVLAAGAGEVVCSVGGVLSVGDEVARCAGPPTSASFSPDGTVLAVAADPKTLLILRRTESSGFRTVLQVSMQKRLAAVTFAPSGRAVLAADRFGDVHEVKVPDVGADGVNAESGPCEKRNVKDEDVPLLGHFCTVTDVAINDKFVATSDRERRIRVSHYPRAVVIESFCLGHTDFVSRVAWAPSGLLLSGGGDGFVRLWDPISAEELTSVSLPGRSEGSSPPVVFALGVDPVDSDIVVAAVHDSSKLLVLSGLTSRQLRVACEFQPPDLCNVEGWSVSNFVFDSKGRLWVSSCESLVIASYRLPKADGKGFMCSGDVFVDERIELKALSSKPDAVAKSSEPWTPGRWLGSLRKPVYDADWKGKGRKRRRHAEAVSGNAQSDSEKDGGSDEEG